MSVHETSFTMQSTPVRNTLRKIPGAPRKSRNVHPYSRVSIHSKRELFPSSQKTPATPKKQKVIRSKDLVNQKALRKLFSECEITNYTTTFSSDTSSTIIVEKVRVTYALGEYELSVENTQPK